MYLRSFKIQLPPNLPFSLAPTKSESLMAGETLEAQALLWCSDVCGLFRARKSLVIHPENSEDAITEALQITDVRQPVSFPGHASHGLPFLLHCPSSMLLPPGYRLPYSSESLESFHTVCPFPIPTVSRHHAPFWLSSPIQGWMLVCGPEASTIFWVGKPL